VKLYVYLALAVVLIAAAKWGHSIVYKSGWNAAVVEQGVLIRNAQREAIDIARKEWENTAALANELIESEERIVERVTIVEKRIPQIVEKIVTITPECFDLGADFAELLNAQVGSGSDRSNDSADIAAELNP